MADLTFTGSGAADLKLKAPTPEELAKKAAETAEADLNAPLPPSTLSKEETEKNEADARRFLVTGGSTPVAGQMAPDDAAIKRVVDEHYEKVLVESKERLEKRGPILGHRELTPSERDMVARNNWAMISKDRSTWRTLNDDDKLGMMRLGLKDHKEVEKIRDTYGQSTSWWEDIRHGGWGYFKSVKIGRYPSIGQVLGAFEGGATPADKRMEQNNKQRSADQKLFWSTLKELKENPKAYRKEVVDGLIEKIKKTPDLMTKSGIESDPEFKAVMSSLNKVEMADLIMALKEEVPSAARRIGEAKGEILYKGKESLSANQTPLRITDFDLDTLDSAPEWDPRFDSLWAGNLGQGSGSEYSKEERAKYIESFKQSGLKGKINPIDWMSRAWGKGMFNNGDNVAIDSLKEFGAKAINFTPIGVVDAGVSGAEMLYEQVFGPALDPTSTWGHLKSGKFKDWWSMINGDPSLADPKVLVANFDSAMLSQDEIEGITLGKKSHLIARAGAMVSSYTTEEVREALYKYGAMNAQLVNVGLMRINPAGLVGRASAMTKMGQTSAAGLFGSAGALAEMAAKNGIIKIATKDAINTRLAVYGTYLQTIEGATLGAATRVTGWVVGKGGRVMVGAFGIAGQGVAKLAEVMAPKLGMTYNPAVFKYAMRTIGITDAFLGYGVSTKFAALWGFGKGAAELGGMLQKYGYRGAARTGVGLVSTLEDMAVNTTLTGVTRTMAKVAANVMGPFSAPLYDIVKGAWHGAGVGYGLGFMQDGHRGGVHGIWGGVGIGGMSAGLASFAQYRSGIWTHTGATVDARKMAKGTVSEQIVEDLIKAAEFDKDWNRIPLLVGAVKMANGINTKVIFHREGDTAHINGNVLRLDAVLDADFNIGGRQYRVRELKAEVERLHQQAIAEATVDSTRDLAAETRRIAGEKNAELSIEINKWLGDIKLNGTKEQRSRINTRQNAYNGVFHEGEAGNGIIYINVDRSGLLGNSGMAANTVGGHEVYHAVQHLIAREQAISYFRNSMFGIGDENGLLVAQKGAVDQSLLKEFGDLYIDTLHRDDPNGAKTARDDLQSAYDTINDSQASPVRVKNARDLLNLYAEEFGAFYFESYLQRKRSDFLFRGGQASGLRRLTNQLENFIDFQTQKDLNGQGIALRIRDVNEIRASKEMQDVIARLQKVGIDFSRTMAAMEKLVIRNQDGTVAKFLNKPLWESLAQKAERLRSDKIALDKAVNKSSIGEIFRTKDGKFLINPVAERAMDDLMKRLSNKGAGNALDLSNVPADELGAVLRRAGLEHWQDSNGKLKSPELVEQERAARGNMMLGLLEAQGPKVTGIVVSQDKHGNKRGIGILTDEGLNALKNSGMLLPKEVINLAVLRDTINGVSGLGLGGSQIQFIYNALTHEYYADDGSVAKLRKPKHQVLPTFREVVPYKMEFVMTNKDRDGNVITPHFEIMVTGIDLGVILKRGAEEFNNTYTLPSGAVVNVADLFGGSMDVMVHHLRRYSENLSDGGLPSAELFGGGEQGAAIRDIMFRIMGAIPKGGFGPNGEALLYNNPIIRPFHAWERGPNFAFTTFRLDLMQDLAVTTGNWRLNEPNFYPKAAGNYQPPSFGAPKIIEKDGQKFTMMTASYVFEKIGKRDGISKQSKVQYTIINKDNRWFVAANDFEKPYPFSTVEQAKDFIHIDSQRRQLIGQNLLGTSIMGGDKGIVVASIDGNLVLVDSTKKYKIVAGKAYRNTSEAIIAATRMHNKLLMDNIRAEKHPHLRLFEAHMTALERMQDENPELLPARLDMNRDGTPKTEAIKDSEGKEVKYTADDVEVKRGYAKIGSTKRTLKFQKVSYGLMEMLAGSDHYRMGDPAVNAHAEEVAMHLELEALEAAKDPAKAKGLGWYRHMVRDGYSIYGTVYGMFAEGQGATSAKTPVKENFKQAEEALAMFAQGKYNEVLSRVHEQLRLLHEKAGRKDTNGISEFEAEAVDLLRAKEAAKKANEINKTDYEWDDIVNFKNLEGEDAIPEQVVQDFVQALKELEATPRNRLTPTQLSEGLNAAKSKIFRDKANLMLRKNGKKYNSNTVKVGQVMYNLWHELTEGPKTPNFAENLAGTSRAATIDVWAARTLHRLISTKIKRRGIWRLNASMETGVDYLWHNHGTAEFPQWEGGGDFFFGQTVFEKAAARLRQRGGEFAEIMPDDLQALIWFHEKGVWDKMGWTKTIGAEMSSFEGPMNDFSGARDPFQINDYQNIRRIVAGFSGSYDSVGLTQIKGVPMSAVGSARRFAFPKEKIEQFSGFVADALGNALRGSNIGQTVGVSGGRAEHSLMFDVIAHRGKGTILANARAVAVQNVNNAARLLRQYTEQMSASIDIPVRDELQKKINQKTKDLRKAQLLLDTAEANDQAERDNPTLSNQLGLLADYLVTQAKNYSQKDVLVGELVGANHPNARPAGDIMFSGSVSQADAMLVAKSLSEKNPLIDGFTLIPDPRNPHAAEISKLSNEMSKMDPNSKAAKEIQKKIDGLTKYIGIQAACTPEITARYKEFSKIPEIQSGNKDLLSEEGARWYMDSWQTGLKDLISQNPTVYGTQLRLNAFHLSSETIPRGAFDTFNSAEIGRDVGLAIKLQRYKNGLERETALAAENERTGDLFTGDTTVFENNRTTWSPTSTERGVGGRATETLGVDASGQDQASTKGNVTLTAEQAVKWIKDKMATPIIQSEGGVVWGDKNFQITQKRAADGTLTNTFEIIGAFDRKPIKVVGKKAAEDMLKGRLTGEVAAQGGERTIEINGEQFKVNEATNPIKANDSAALVNIGVYPDTSNIFKYRPDDGPTVEFHPWNTKTIDEAFPLSLTARFAIVPFSHRASKYLMRMDALIQRLSTDPQNVNITLNLTSSGRDNPETHNGQQWGAYKHRAFDIRIYATAPQNSYSAGGTGGTYRYSIADTNGTVSITDVTDQKLYLTTPIHTSNLNAPQPRDAPNRTGFDEGHISGTHAMDGTTYSTVKALDALLNDAALMSEFNQEFLAQQNNTYLGYSSEFAFASNWLRTKANKLQSDHTTRYGELAVQGKALDANGKEVPELQAMNDEYQRVEKIRSSLSRSSFGALASQLKIPLTLKNMYDLAYETQGAGDAVNAEVGARLKAAGLLGEGTRGLSSYIVNKTGAVFKNRRNTYGEGNTEHRMHDSNYTITTDSATAIAINIGELANANIATWVKPTRLFSPSSVEFQRAFNDSAIKGSGGLYSDYSEHNLPKGLGILFRTDYPTNKRSDGVDTHAGNVDVSVVSDQIGMNFSQDFGFQIQVGYKHPDDFKGAYYERPDLLIPTGEVTFENVVGLGRLTPELTVAVFRETIARLTSVGVKSVRFGSAWNETFYRPDGSEYRIPNLVADSLESAMGKSPDRRKNGWEGEGADAVWDIDAKRKYSPSFVPFERLFDEKGLKSGEQFWSKTAARELAGKYSLDFEQVKDNELREGMTDAPMGGNTKAGNPMTFITLNDSGYRGESAAEFYLMINREAPEGRPNETSQMAVLQMRKKAVHITVDPLVGAIAEIVERLKMTGVTQLWIPREGYTAADYRKLTDEVVDVYTKLYEGQYDVDAAERDFVTNVDEHDGLKIVFAGSKNPLPSPLTTKNGPVDVYRIDRSRKYSPSGHPEDSFVDRILKVNIEKFGLTRDPYEGGYLLPNGSMLDLSGRRDATGFKREGDYYVPSGRKGRDDFAGQRYTDHREVILPDGIKAPVGAHEASRYNMVKAMQATGAIRMSQARDHTLLDIGLKPTSSQLSMIKDLIRDSNDKRSIQLDLRDTTRPDENGWEREAGLSYPEGTDPNKVVRDINRFYAGNDVKPDFSPSGYGAAESMAAGAEMGAGAKYKANPYMAGSAYYMNWKKGALKQGESADWWAYWDQNGGTLDELIFTWQMAQPVSQNSNHISISDFKNLITRQLAKGNLKWDKMKPREQNALDMFLFMDAFSGTTYEKGIDSVSQGLLDAQIKLDVRDERSNAQATDESQLMALGDRWISTSPDFSTVVEEWNHMLYGSMMDRDAGGHKIWETLLNPPSLMPARRQVSGSKTQRRFEMSISEAQAEGLSDIPLIAQYKDAPSYIAAMRSAMAERVAFMKTQHTKSSAVYKFDNNVDLPADTSQELARDIIRQAAMHTIVESWLRVLEGTQANDMASMRNSVYVRSKRKELGREPTAADLALANVDPKRFNSDGRPRQKAPYGIQQSLLPDVGGAGYKYSLEGPRTYTDPKGSSWANDYNFVTIVEYVAGILKSPQTQLYLSDLPPMEKSPLDDILQHLEQHAEGEGKQYATELNSLWSKSINAFQQLLASVRLYAQVFSSKGNWKDKMKRGEADPRKAALKNYSAAPENKTRTLLDDAVKAAFLIRPRSLTTETTTYLRGTHGNMPQQTAKFTASGLDAVARALQSVQTKENVRDNQGTIQMGTAGAIGQFVEARKIIAEGKDFLAQHAEQVKINAALEANLRDKMKNTKAGIKNTLRLYTPKKPENTVVYLPARKIFWALHSEAKMHTQDSSWNGIGYLHSDKRLHAKPPNTSAVDWQSMDTPEVRDLVAMYRKAQAENKTASIKMIELYKLSTGYGWSEPSLRGWGSQGNALGDQNWIMALALHAPMELIPIQVPKADAPWFRKHFTIGEKEITHEPIK